MTALRETNLLAEELTTYQAHKQDLLANAAGKYVVINGNAIFGLFDDKSTAYTQAYRHFGNVAMLVRRGQEQEEVYYIGGSGMGLNHDITRYNH